MKNLFSILLFVAGFFFSTAQGQFSMPTSSAGFHVVSSHGTGAAASGAFLFDSKEMYLRLVINNLSGGVGFPPATIDGFSIATTYFDVYPVTLQSETHPQVFTITLPLVPPGYPVRILGVVADWPEGAPGIASGDTGVFDFDFGSVIDANPGNFNPQAFFDFSRTDVFRLYFNFEGDGYDTISVPIGGPITPIPEPAMYPFAATLILGAMVAIRYVRSRRGV